MAAFFLSKGANVNAKSRGGTTPLLVAAGHGHETVAKLLIKHGADVNARGTLYELAPLHVTCRNGHTRISKLLLDSGAEVNVRDAEGFTALDHAVKQGHGKIARLLRKRGAKSGKSIEKGKETE